MAPESLGRYFSILEGKKLPRYLISRATPVKRPGRGLKDAWGKHGKKVPGKKAGAREEFPTYSLLHLKHYISKELLKSCVFCERMCRVDRRKALGFCKVGNKTRVSSAFVHLGEEPELVPSGTIFFSGCNLKCSFCQNWDISQNAKSGYVWKPEMIAAWVRGMRNGIRNVNFVGGEPTPNLHTILASLLLMNVKLPVVWNSNMYMSKLAMELLDGVVDVYLSDFKYGNDACAERLSGTKAYFGVVSRNHLAASRGAELIIRHLVLPGHVECCSKPVLGWIAENLGRGTRVNIMRQYRPEHVAEGELRRDVSGNEYLEAVGFAKDVGLKNLVGH